MSAEAHQEILRTEGLSKFFPGVKALAKVDVIQRLNATLACGAAKSWPCWAKTAPENRR